MLKRMYGDRCFPKAAALLCNHFPASLRHIHNITAFQRGLKTFLFRQEYKNSLKDYYLVFLPITYVWIWCYKSFVFYCYLVILTVARGSNHSGPDYRRSQTCAAPSTSSHGGLAG